MKLTNYNQSNMSASNRKITVDEIQAVGSIIKDKDALELLKKINDEIVTEEDTKGKRKQNDIFAFVGFAHQDDVLGEDPESDDYKNKQGSLKSLIDKGLVLEGFHVPLERKNEKKFGDERPPATNEKIGKFKLTEEGLTVLAIVAQPQQQQEEVKKKDIQKESVPQKTSPEPQQQEEPLTKKEKAIAAFKEEIKEENKL